MVHMALNDVQIKYLCYYSSVFIFLINYSVCDINFYEWQGYEVFF